MLKEYLKSYRLKNNLTQAQMAKLLETSQCYYSLIESGKRTPSFVVVRRLAKLLNVTEEFVRGLL